MVMDKKSIRNKIQSLFKESSLNEMPAWNDTNKSISKGLENNFEKVMSFLERGNFRKVEEVKVVKGYKALITTRNADTFWVFIFEDWLGREVVGEFCWRKNNNGWQTESAAVSEDHQGKGIAWSIYNYMIEKYFKVLYSDTSLTGEDGYGSFNIWVRLSGKYNAYLYSIPNKSYTQVSRFTREMMGDSNILFVVSVDELPIDEPLKELKGGLADGMSIKDIAKKHDVSPSTIRNQIEQGKDVEQEHTDDIKIATNIAKDHEVENPKYYDDLKKAGIDENTLKEMPYLDTTPDINGNPLDLQIEKWTTKEELSNFLTKLFSGEKYSDEKQPIVQMRNPKELFRVLTNFNQDPTNPATQFLIQFTRKFNPMGINVNLKTINRKQLNYWLAFVVNAYNKAKEKKEISN
jgi:predicted DNA-binding protein YlxM (UPF0122 family)